MAWTSLNYESKQADNILWNQIEIGLTGIPLQQQGSIKLAADDVEKSNARALIVYLNDTSAPPDQKTLGAIWKYKEFHTKDKYKLMYDELINFLNNEPLLTPAQKYYSYITMTNVHGHDSHLVLWYRSLAS